MAKYFFCGVGGSGMSALAAIQASRGHEVGGSDRSFDQGDNLTMAEMLGSQGVTIHPQDGSGIDNNLDFLVVSTAIEPSIPDVRVAQEKGIAIIRRAELLREIFERGPAIAVGGTSGKTTVTAMIGHILREAGLSPTVVNGGLMLNSESGDGLGNAWCGRPELCVIEADESDGTIELYHPQVSVLTTVSLDHQPMEELQRLFTGFLERARLGCVVSADCPEASQMLGTHPRTIGFGIENGNATLNATALSPRPDGISFKLDECTVDLIVPGRHNVRNALAAVAAAELHGVERSAAIAALASFKGTHRRLELVGMNAKQITVIDDFAHNPEKIAASLETLTEFDGRLIVFYQPHGFKPTRMLKAELIDAFVNGLRDSDILVMPEIFYAGGTAAKDISSADLTGVISERGKRAFYCPNREAAADMLVAHASCGDRIVVMGARDNTLSEFAADLLKRCG